MVEGGGLLNRYTVINRIEGSNPFLSAITLSLFIPCRGLAIPHASPYLVGVGMGAESRRPQSHFVL